MSDLLIYPADRVHDRGTGEETPDGDVRMIHFTGKVRHYGTSHVVTIPAGYIKNKLLEHGKTYRFDVTEVPDAE